MFDKGINFIDPKEILINGKVGDLVKIGDYKKISHFIKNYKKRKKK